MYLFIHSAFDDKRIALILKSFENASIIDRRISSTIKSINVCYSISLFFFSFSFVSFIYIYILLIILFLYWQRRYYDHWRFKVRSKRYLIKKSKIALYQRLTDPETTPTRHTWDQKSRGIGYDAIQMMETLGPDSGKRTGKVTVKKYKIQVPFNDKRISGSFLTIVLRL